MTRAKIAINAVDGSNDDLVIGTTAALTNDGNGAEVTWLWTLLDRPLNSTAVLSAPSSAATSLGPLDVEGTYLVRLDVNLGSGTACYDQRIAAVRFVKTRLRVPAAGETVENGSEGWSDPVAVDALLRRIDGLLGDLAFGVLAAVDVTGGLVSGNVVSVHGRATLKSGLPGQEYAPEVVLCLGLYQQQSLGMLAVVLSDTYGNAGPYAQGTLLLVRTCGRIGGLTGNPSVGAPVYLGDDGNLALTIGTFVRQLGLVLQASSGTYDCWFGGRQGPPDRLTTATATADASTASPLVIPIPTGGVRRLVAEVSAVDSVGATYAATLRAGAGNVGGIAALTGGLAYATEVGDDIGVGGAAFFVNTGDQYVYVNIAGKAATAISWFLSVTIT